MGSMDLRNATSYPQAGISSITFNLSPELALVAPPLRNVRVFFDNRVHETQTSSPWEPGQPPTSCWARHGT
jgi:hypothetical protein